jgi:hypothetical protein
MSIGSLTSIQQGTLLANEVRAVIAKHLGVDIERVTDDAHFKDDLEAAWLDRVELMITSLPAWKSRMTSSIR